MKKEVFLSDLDHTFLRSDLTLSRYSIDCWNTKANIAYMGIATARSFSKTQELLKGVKINAPMILLDGALIVDPKGRVIAQNALDKESADVVISIGNAFGIDPFIIGENRGSKQEIFVYPRRLNSYQKEVLKGYKNDPRLLFDPSCRALDYNYKIVYFAHESLLCTLRDVVLEQVGDMVEAKLSPEKYGGGWFLSFLHPRGDKAHAFSHVIDYASCSLDDVTVFGDSINDLKMFEIAGCAVAVANALDVVKEKADIVLDRTNDEDAVAWYLSSLH